MANSLGNHFHRPNAENARPFPFSPESTAEIARMVHESVIQNVRVQRRQHARFVLENTRGIVTVMHPGGTLASAEAVVLDISASGIGMLYPGFLHAGTECSIQLKTNDGESVLLPATALWCRFITKNVHSIGLRFENMIDVRNFVPSSQWIEQVASSEDSSKLPLTGRVLLAGFDEIEQSMIQVFLRDTDITILHADFDGAVLDHVQKQAFDLLMIDADSAESDTEQLVTMLRAQGATEPILLVSDRQSMTKVAKQFNQVEVLNQPLQQESFIVMLREMLSAESDPLAGTKPIVSLVAGQAGMSGAISTYIKHCRKDVERLNAAIGSDNTGEALRIAQSIRNTAQGFGFPILSDAATQAITALNASGSAKESAAHIRGIVRIIARLADPEAINEAA